MDYRTTNFGGILDLDVQTWSGSGPLENWFPAFSNTVSGSDQNGRSRPDPQLLLIWKEGGNIYPAYCEGRLYWILMRDFTTLYYWKYDKGKKYWWIAIFLFLSLCFFFIFNTIWLNFFYYFYPPSLPVTIFFSFSLYLSHAHTYSFSLFISLL